MIKIFLDSDVVISSLISKSGVAYLLINSSFPNLGLFVSNLSVQEITKVSKRLNLDQKRLKVAIGKLDKIMMEDQLIDIKKKYRDYVSDIDDTHIVAGAVKSKARFLISYNIKDFKVGKIKQDFNIIVTSPANLIQYLRT